MFLFDRAADFCLSYFRLLSITLFRFLGLPQSASAFHASKDVEQQLLYPAEKQVHFAGNDTFVVDKPKRILVRLPDLFSPAFGLTRTPPVNPHYEKIKLESEAWLGQAAAMTERMKLMVRKINMSYFLAITVSQASPECLKTIFDWGNWVFPFDDQFDDGVITDPEEARIITDSLIASMDDDHSAYPEDSWQDIVKAHHDLWQRIKATSPIGVSRRYKETMIRFAHGIVEQVKHEKAGNKGFGRSVNIGVEEMLDTRRKTVGVEPIFPMIEHALALEIPDEVFEHWTIREFQRIVTDIIIISNDIVSYRKEEGEGNPHNLVAVCRTSGMPAQQAFDFVGAMLDARYKDWAMALDAVPSWGSTVDRQVQAYIHAVQYTAVGNNNWSFKSKRYFGDMTDVVKATMIIDVLPDVVVA